MIFKELLDMYNDEVIVKNVIKLYPDQKKNKKGYLVTLSELRNLEPIITEMEIDITLVENQGDPYIDVHGLKEGETYALSYTYFEEWLGYTINEYVFKDFKDIDILAHCIWEMTWNGFTNKQIKEKIELLNDRIKEISEDEWTLESITW